MGQHAKLSASGSERWMTCTATVTFCENIVEEESSEPARMGSAAHALGEMFLMQAKATIRKLKSSKGNKSSVDLTKFLSILDNINVADKIGTNVIEIGTDFIHEDNVDEIKKFKWTKAKIKKAHKWEVDKNMAYGIQVYIDAVCLYLSEYTGHIDIDVEEFLHFEHKDLGGTGDLLAAQPFGDLLIIDYKNGRWPVEVEKSYQLRYYGVGALKKYPTCTNVRTVIVQPNADHGEGNVRSFDYTAEEILEFEKEMMLKVEEVYSDNPVFSVGKHCSFCSGKPTCRASYNKVQEIAKMEFTIMPNKDELFQPLTEIEMAQVMQWGDIITGWIGSVFAKAHNTAENGFKVPGYKLVTKTGNRAYIEEVEDVENIFKEKCEEFGIDTKLMYSEPKLKTPAQMEKIDKRMKPVVAENTEKPNKGTVLVKDDDYRVEILFEGDFNDIDSAQDSESLI